MLLIGRFVIRVARRKHHAFYAEIHHLVEEAAHTVRIRAIEKRGIRGDTKTALQSFFYGSRGDLVATLAADRKVVMFTLAVQVDGKTEVLAGLEKMQLLFEKKSISAEIDVLLARDQTFNDFGDLRVHQRLAAGNGHRWCATFINRFKTFVRCQLAFEYMRRILDFAAAGASKIAPEERLEHQH